tara:strand:- start:485 stop:646 length:162 start_codon:yes stop_codon:yes gene_type:complete
MVVVRGSIPLTSQPLFKNRGKSQFISYNIGIYSDDKLSYSEHRLKLLGDIDKW